MRKSSPCIGVNCDRCVVLQSIVETGIGLLDPGKSVQIMSDSVFIILNIFHLSYLFKTGICDQHIEIRHLLDSYQVLKKYIIANKTKDIGTMKVIIHKDVILSIL